MAKYSGMEADVVELCSSFSGEILLSFVYQIIITRIVRIAEAILSSPPLANDTEIKFAEFLLRNRSEFYMELLLFPFSPLTSR